MRVSPSAPAVTQLPVLPRSEETQPISGSRCRRGSHAHSSESLHLVLSTRAFRCVWLAIVTAHALCGLATLGIAQLYFFLASPSEAHKYSSLQVSVPSMRRSGYSFALVSAAHGVAVARILVHSLRSRQLALSSSVRRRRRSVASHYEQPHRQSRGLLAAARRRVLAAWRLLRRPWDVLFSRDGYFGLRGAHFDAAFQVREAFEVVLQTYQAYNLSRSVSKRWINTLAVAAIAANCCATPLAHTLFRGESKTLTRRVFCRVADMVLDVCCSLVIPFCVFYPYWRDYDAVTQQFYDDLFYDDIWYVNAMTEGRYVLITSFADYVSTLLPHTTIFLCLVTIASLVQRRSPRKRSRVPSLVPQAPAKRRVHGSQLSPPAPLVVVEASSNAAMTTHRALPCVFVVWGLAVAALHLYAQLNTWDDRLGCKLRLNPWFTRNYACSVMEVNCFRQRTTGRADDLATVLASLDRLSLQALFFTHCPALEVPFIVQEFPHVGGIEVFNCTIERWDADAAVTAAHHARISYVFIMFSNLSRIPDGLLHAELPDTFTHIDLYETNLSVVPDTIAASWGVREWIFIGFEFCQLTSVPEALGDVRTHQLYLNGNALTSVPSSIFETDVLDTVLLSENPLRELPSHLATRPFEIEASNTSATAIPSWLRAWALAGALAESTLGDTPFCDALVDASQSALSSPDAALTAQLCTHASTTTFPLDIILPQRQL